jgi:hypothetical protein
MYRSFSCLFAFALVAGFVACTPVAIPPQTSAQQQEAYDRDRYQAKIRFDPVAPQSISGFLRLARVSSATMGSAGVLMSGGNPRDLDAIIDAVNEFTDVEAEFAGDIPYGHPALFALPIVIPQSEPNEAEMEQLVRYLTAGGFILAIDLGLEIYREGLEKYGGLVWGRDAWVERLPDDHPIFFSYFSIAGGLPAVSLSPVPGSLESGSPQPIRGLFINDRLAGVVFRALASPQLPGTTVGGVGAFQAPPVDEEEIHQRLERRSDPRLRQMMVNIVVYALTQDGSIAQQVIAE